MANQTVSIPEELKHFFSFVPENAVLFGGAIRDLVSGKTEVKDINLLFKNKEDIDDFFANLKKHKNVKYYRIYKKEYKATNLSKIIFGDFSGKIYEVDCVVAKDQEHAFLSDYDVNSLYGKVNNDNVEILGSITCDNVNKVISHIKENLAESRFLKQTEDNVKAYRTNKIQGKGFRVNNLDDFIGYNFLSSKQIFEVFEAVKNEVSESSKTETNANNSSKENKKMTNSNKSFSEFLTSNLVEGAYAGAAASTIDNLAKGLLVGMKKAGLDDASLMMAEMMMNHPMGKSLLALMVGSGIELLPVEAVKNNPHIQKIGEKCIQNAGSEGVQFALEGAMKYVLPALMGAIQSTPQLSLLEQVNSSEKLRVPTSASANKEEDIPDEANPISNLLKNIKQSA